MSPGFQGSSIADAASNYSVQVAEKQQQEADLAAATSQGQSTLAQGTEFLKQTAVIADRATELGQLANHLQLLETALKGNDPKAILDLVDEVSQDAYAVGSLEDWRARQQEIQDQKDYEASKLATFTVVSVGEPVDDTVWVEIRLVVRNDSPYSIPIGADAVASRGIPIDLYDYYPYAPVPSGEEITLVFRCQSSDYANLRGDTVTVSDGAIQRIVFQVP